jgi:UDPglucose--hexose-1-phosphate uridylyltransferase
MTSTVFKRPHRRFNLLTGESVVVSPQRLQRPWDGRAENVPLFASARNDSNCYLCPGNSRAGGARDPAYTSTYVFPNAFPALLPDTAGEAEPEPDDLLRAQGLRGECRVMCFSPRHDLTLAQMGTQQIGGVVDLWSDQVAELGERWRWV